MPISNPSLPSVPDGLHVDDLRFDAASLVMSARTIAVDAVCPSCGQPLGSAGQSIIADLPALKGELTATSPDGFKIGALMTKLGNATTQAAGGNADLETLGAQLSKLGA